MRGGGGTGLGRRIGVGIKPSEHSLLQLKEAGKLTQTVAEGSREEIIKP